MNSPVSGWQRDPTARHEYRYWDGNRWTDDVSDRGVTSTDPMPPGGPGGGPGADPTQVIDPTQAFPPAQTETYAPAPPAGYPSDGAQGFGPYGTLPNQPGSYGGYGNGTGAREPGPPSGSGGKTGLFVGIAVLVVAAVAGLAFLLTKDDDNNSDETSNVPLSDETTTPSDDSTSTLPSDEGSGDEGSGDPGAIDSLDDLAGVDPDDISEEDLIPLLAEELSSSGLVNEEQATCMAEAMLDTFSFDEILALGESGATDPMSALTPEQISAISDAAVDCLGA